MRRSVFTGFLVILLASAPSAWALSTDEVIQLKRNAIGDDVVVAMMRGDGSRFDMSAAEVQRLQTAGVSDRVIQAMREVSAPVTPPPSSYSPLDRETRRGMARSPEAAASAQPADVAAAAGRATITVHNQDDRVKAYAWDPARRELRFFPDSRKDAKDFAKGATAPLEIETGVLALRWDGEYQHYRVSLLPGAKLDFFVEPSVANGAQAIRVALVRGGRFFAAYNLKVFYGRAVAAQPMRYCPPCPTCPQGGYVPACDPAPACVIVQPEPEPCESTHVDFSFGAAFGH